MWKRKASTLAALALTGLLFLFSPFLQQEKAPAALPDSLIRIWIKDDEPAVSRWLKKQIARYERENGRRIYLRSASMEEMEGAMQGDPEIILPDLMIMQGLDEALLFRGYALIVRDDNAKMITPQPTSALFFRPSSLPMPSPTPGPTPDFFLPSPILIPAFLSASLPGSQISENVLSDFSLGKAPAAVLTAGQAEQLAFGFRAYAIENGEGLLPVHGKALSKDGAVLLAFLQEQPAQQALCEYGLYSFRKDLSLYDPGDSIRFLIENSRK